VEIFELPRIPLIDEGESEGVLNWMMAERILF
jgi:hypothetical protein